ncbi:hypothetical protein Tco_1023474, partial [Tanacetum coccineum]
IESSEDDGLGAQEDASKQGRKIADLDADAEVTLVDEAHGRIDDNLIATTTTVDELTLAQTLIEIKAAKPKVVTTAATTTTTAVTRPKSRGVVVQEPSEFRTTKSSSQTSQLPQVKDKGKAKMHGRRKLEWKQREELESDNSKKQKIDDNVEDEVDDEAKIKKHIEIVPDDEVAIDVILLATKSPIIVD